MPNRFVWLDEPQAVLESRQGEPPPWPREVLDRHGLRELRPAEAVPDARQTPRANEPRQPVRRLRSTVYRAGTLLVPDELFDAGNSDSLTVVNEVAGEDHQLLPLERPTSLDRDGLGGLPRPVALVRTTDGPPPDAWDVLQSMRKAVRDGRFTGRRGAELVDQISIEHVLFGAMYGPGPNGDPHGLGDDAGGSPARAGYGRRPVAHLGEPPARPQVTGRRPRIAVLDTGFGSCSWFGTTTASKGLPQGGFLQAYEVTQQMISAQSASLAGLIPTEVLLQSWEEPLYTDGVSQVLAPAVGHGTFIAGLIRQHAPGADVLSVRVLQPDNVAYESDVLLALHMLLADVRAGDPVDVISLSLGYYPEDPDDPQASRLQKVLQELADEGVLIVACAGNDSTARPFLPAALAWAPKWTGPRVTGVGALNPNGTVAWFSNTGKCCNCLAPGANLVSVFPDDVRGSGNPSAGLTGREGMDPDDYSSGFATWSGTSFAAPLVAAELARLLAEDDLDAQNVVLRAERVLERIKAAAP